MKALKYLLYVIAGLIVLLIVAIAIVAATFDPNDYKPQIVQLVKDRTGRTLTIEGDIGLKLFPKIGAEVGKVSLSDPAGTSEFAGLNQAQVYLALLPLLSRQVVVDEVRVDGLRANLIKHKDGSTNFSDLTGAGGKAESAPPAQPAQPSGPVRLDISGVRITNSRVTWKDEGSGNDLAIDLAELKTGRIAEKTPSKVELTATVKGVQPKVDLKAVLAGVLTFDLAGQQYGFKGLDAKLTGAALDFTDIALALAGDVEALAAAQRVAVSGLKLEGKAGRGKDLYNLKLSAPAIESTPEALSIADLALSASGTLAGMQLISSDLKVPSVRMNLERSLILLEGLALSAKAKAGSDNLEVDLSAPKLAVTPEQASGASAALTARLTGAQRNANVVLKLSGVEGSAKALKIAALTLDVDAKQEDNALKGQLSTPVTGNLETKVFELPKLAANFTVTSPSIPQKTVQVPLSGLVRADLGKERVLADIVTRFDESNIKAKGGVTRFAKPAYDFDVTIDRLNLDRYMPPKKAEDKPAQDKPAPAGPEQPIDLSPLKPLDLTGSLKVGALQVNNVKAANVRVDLRAKDGKLTVDPLSANLYEGSTKGALNVDANTNRFVVKQTLSGIAIGPLLRDAAQKDLLEGRGNVALDLTTQGNLVSALKKALNGNAQLALKDGAVKGIDLAGAVRTVKAKFGGKDAEGTASRGEKTDFSELTASFDIKDGIAHNDDLNLKSPFIRVGGEGDVNIPASSLDYVVKVALVGSMAGQGGKELTELKGFTVPVRLSGPFTALKYKVELSQMFAGKEAQEAVKATVKETARKELEKLLGGKPKPSGADGGEQPAGGDPAQQAAPSKKPEEQLKEKLKDLFK
jgi:AsmA protein